MIDPTEQPTPEEIAYAETHITEIEDREYMEECEEQIEED